MVESFILATSAGFVMEAQSKPTCEGWLRGGEHRGKENQLRVDEVQDYKSYAHPNLGKSQIRKSQIPDPWTMDNGQWTI